MLARFAPSRLFASLDRRVVGQVDAKRILAVDGHLHSLRLGLDPDVSDEARPQRRNALLLGPTGSGKSELVRNIAAAVGVPCVLQSCTALSKTGYVGTNTHEIPRHVLESTRGNRTLAEIAVVHLDEVDKIARSATSGVDVSGLGVQQDLLPLLEGATIGWDDGGKPGSLATNRIWFIATGAFDGIEAIIRRRLEAAGGIGFGTPRRPLDDAAILQRITTEDLVEYGFIPEFIGRFEDIATLDPLSDSDLLRILDACEGSPVRDEARYFSLHGIELRFTRDALRELAGRAAKLHIGARGLRRVVGEATRTLRYVVCELAAAGVTCVEIDGAALRGTGLPTLAAARRGRRDRAHEDGAGRRSGSVDQPTSPRLERILTSLLTIHSNQGGTR